MNSTLLAIETPLAVFMLIGSVCGNVLVIVLVLSLARLRELSNVLLCHLSLVDLLISLDAFILMIQRCFGCPNALRFVEALTALMR